MQMPGGVPGGGMVRVGIERDIMPSLSRCRIDYSHNFLNFAFVD